MQAGSVAFGGSMVFSGMAHSTHTHTRPSTALQAGLIVDPVLKMKPSTLIQQSTVKPLPSRRLYFHMSAPPRAPTVIGMERELWVGGGLCSSAGENNLLFPLRTKIE